MVGNFDDSRTGDLHVLQLPRNNGIRCEWGMGSGRLILKLCRDRSSMTTQYWKRHNRNVIDISTWLLAVGRIWSS